MGKGGGAHTRVFSGAPPNFASGTFFPIRSKVLYITIGYDCYLFLQAYYNRGLTKMKLKHAKSIHDFNRALAINPKLFQVCFCRHVLTRLTGLKSNLFFFLKRLKKIS